MKKRTLGFVTVLLLAGAVWADEETEVKKPKPFGLGIGPTYIGGRDTDAEGTELSLTIYKQFINFKRLTKQSLADDENYYSRQVLMVNVSETNNKQFCIELSD